MRNASQNEWTFDAKQASIRGLTTSWIEEGVRGRPIVFLCHGFPDSAASWDHQIQALNSDYHVIAPYVRGCDRSERPQDQRRYQTDAILLDHLSILKLCDPSDKVSVTVVGHDLGVVHAIKLARALGPRLKGLVVLNGTDIRMFSRRLSNPKQVSRSWYMGLMQVPFIPEALAKLAPVSCSWLAGEIGGLPIALRDAKNFDRRTIGPLNQYRAMAVELARDDRRPQKRLSAPMLVLWGRKDGFLEPPTRAEWDRTALNVTIRIIDGGHWIHREKPELVTPLILEFVNHALTTTSNATSGAQ